MRKRCENPNCKSYADYGGRGIAVCERWQSFDNFLADMGVRPDGMSLDRIDSDGNYEPSNCRWATRIEQSHNSRASKLEPHEAEQIRWLIAEGFSASSCARFFEISLTQVSRIRDGKCRTALK